MSPQSSRNLILHPVILPVPADVQEMSPKDRVVFLSRHARCALAESAQRSAIRPGELLKDKNGRPLPFDGTFWSITHKMHYVGGVVAPTPIGIDIERIRNISGGVFRKTASEGEWALVDAQKKSLLTFFRFWTSKEAVLKATGIGIKDLLQCKVHQVLDDRHLTIHYERKTWLIEHFFFNRHIASIVQNNYATDWILEK